MQKATPVKKTQPAKKPATGRETPAAKTPSTKGGPGTKKTVAKSGVPAEREPSAEAKVVSGAVAGSRTTTREREQRAPGGDRHKVRHEAGNASHVIANGAPIKSAPRPVAKIEKGKGPYASDAAFLDEQRKRLHEERKVYEDQAAALRAEAESLALEREPGDVQFDEESGEGGTVAVDRERDLTLSARAIATISEIDVALKAIADKTYGACEVCGKPIPKERLRALPYARQDVGCKSGGLHRR